jgi:hypothetical protein
MYALDAKAAKESDQIGGYLKDTGRYVGKFTRAEKLISSNKGTHGVGFTFMDDSGQSTRFDIWTMNAQEEQLSGYKSLMAIMTCMKVRNLTVVAAEVERYDYDAKERYTEEAEVFAELTGKPIGLLLRNTEYEKMRDGQKTGETGWRLELYAPFDAASGFTAGEIIDKKKTPEQLAKIEAGLADRPLKKGNSPAPTRQAASSQSKPRAAANFSDMDDDIPF